jgi:hypothetical protein
MRKSSVTPTLPAPTRPSALPASRKFAAIFRIPIFIFVSAAPLTYGDFVAHALDANEKPREHSVKPEAVSLPLSVTVFYSSEDPHWINVEKLVDQIARQKGASVIFRKVCIDAPEGYQELAELEKKHAVEKSGDLTVQIKDFVLTSQGARRDAELYLEAVINRFLEPESMKERRRANVAAHAKRIFGEDAHLTPEGERPGISACRVLTPKQKEPVGWIVEVSRTIACGLCRTAHFLITIAEPDGKVVDLVSLNPIERYGKNIPDLEAKKFLNQFVGRTFSPSQANAEGEKKVDKWTVDAISGATKTSHIYETGVMEALQWLETLKARKKE